jgi:hypothetical protein
VKRLGNGESALAKIATFAVSLISLAISYKFFNFTGWVTFAYVGGALLFFVIAVIIGAVFDIGLLLAMLVSSFTTALIMGPILLSVSLVMVIIAMITLFLMVGVKAYEEGGYGSLL